ncbi:MAG: ankyrin repeat domain-containing protein [Limisphaerales bacterium]
MELRRSNFPVFCFAAMIAFHQIGPALATDLIDAVRAGNVARVGILLDSGADPNKRPSYNGPLHDAARMGSAEITTILIKAGADVELSGFGGIRPLHSAAMAGQAKVVTILLKSGAKVDSRDNTGRTPLLSFMSGHTADVSTLIALLEAGADPNLLDGPVPYHPLDYAAMHGRADVTELLIAFGADMNAKDNLYGGTPLHYAIWFAPQGHLEVAELLINRGADVNAKDANGLTPLDHAKRNAPNAGLLQLLLIEAGAK